MLAKKDILNFLNSLNCDCKQNEPMSKHTSFKIGGNAEFFVMIYDEDSLAKLLIFTQENNINTYIIGNGSNILVNDDGLSGICIKYADEDVYLDEHDNTLIHCKAGASLAKVCKFALENSLTGLEFAWGIPGSVGGAIYMNAGAYDGQMKDIVLKVYHCKQNGAIDAFSADKLHLSYRYSIYSTNDFVITEAVLKLKQGDRYKIKTKMDDLMSRRISKQPLNFPSAGSTFKRPSGYFAGKLIDECGLRGKTIGGATVSEKHCGFIINNCNATAKDVKALITYIQDTVEQQKGVKLECEIKMI